MAVDEGLAQLSNQLFAGAVGVYATAMLGYAAEFAFSRFGRSSAPAGAAEAADDERAPADERELVGAAVATQAASGPAAAGGGGTVAVPGQRTAAGRTASPPPATPRRGDDDADEPARARWIGRIAVALTVIGWALHVGSVVTRGFAADRVPWGNMYEFSSMITLAGITIYLVLLARYPIRWLGVFVTLPMVITLGFAGTVLYTDAGPLVPALNSYWLKIHVLGAILASGAFMVSAVITVLFLVKQRWENRLTAVAVGKAPVSGAMRRRGGIIMRLPSSNALDTLTYRLIAFAFPIWTFAIIAGAIWAEAAWGRYWGWDPKETWSFITWVCYAAYLHARATAGWRGTKAAVVSLVAFSALFVDYYLVNLVIQGLHSYAGV